MEEEHKVQPLTVSTRNFNHTTLGIANEGLEEDRPSNASTIDDTSRVKLRLDTCLRIICNTLFLGVCLGFALSKYEVLFQHCGTKA